jgi:hypothetical protein
MNININKYTKKDLIDIILIHYLKKDKFVEINLNKISKQKLIDIIIDNNIYIYNYNELIEETLEIEKFNNLLETIFYNYMKFKNINITIIKKIQNNNLLTSNDLQLIINQYNLYIDCDINTIKKYNKIMSDISNVINKNKIYN